MKQRLLTELIQLKNAIKDFEMRRQHTVTFFKPETKTLNKGESKHEYKTN